MRFLIIVCGLLLSISAYADKQITSHIGIDVNDHVILVWKQLSCTSGTPQEPVIYFGDGSSAVGSMQGSPGGLCFWYYKVPENTTLVVSDVEWEMNASAGITTGHASITMAMTSDWQTAVSLNAISGTFSENHYAYGAERFVTPLVIPSNQILYIRHVNTGFTANGHLILRGYLLR